MRTKDGPSVSRRGERAEMLFREGYNCAQAVFCAFDDLTGFDRETSARLSSSFGGGMGRLREACGAVSGALMTLGILLGYTDPKDRRAKADHYRLVQEFAARFRDRNGSIVCRELLAGVDTSPGPEPQERSDEFYQKRPCARLVRQAAEIAAEMLEEAGASAAAERENTK
ncbi:MAG: C_GCAxxG_C_C family protein [Clostridia bacterium]|nr:C_GCAxxG_C_C family protein [Clostridia bacterium]